MKYLLVISVIFSGIAVLSFSVDTGNEKNVLVGNTLKYFKTNAVAFANSTTVLKDKVVSIKKGDSISIQEAKEALIKCRLEYKKIEFFMSYFFQSAALLYNGANKYEVEEPYMEYRDPTGLQLVEALLYSDAFEQKQNLLDHVLLMESSAEDLPSLLFNLKVSDKQILESIRLALIRIITLGISGFDAPELKTGITESRQVISTIKIILQPLLSSKNKEGKEVSLDLNTALNLLDENSGFDNFNRLQFLTESALPLQYHLGLLIRSRGLDLNTTGVLNYDARHLFSKDAINIPGHVKGNQLVKLGQKLFFEKGLSGNSTRSCATCHQPEKYFTDGIPKSIALNGLSTVERNAPTLLYAGFQYSQFWDGKAKNLDEQINTVLISTKEMAGEHKILLKRLRASKLYVEEFKKAFPKPADKITIKNISSTLTAFMESLSPFNSNFDRYIRGNKNALSKQQVKGFNLFMGKALCGTCHFAPVFNGLVPPLYNRTEFEVLGVTSGTDFTHPQMDNDSGRYTTFPISFYFGAFKTPTVRNVARTAPYMHNGAFATLEQVMEFYNKGGAVGLGIKMPTQTLSSKPLNLDSSEIRDIISFLHSLTDTIILP